jgi:hypothetical protein
MSIFRSRKKVMIFRYGVFLLLRQAESSARSLVFEGVGAAFEVGAGEAFEFEWLWYRTEERYRIITLK